MFQINIGLIIFGNILLFGSVILSVIISILMDKKLRNRVHPIEDAPAAAVERTQGIWHLRDLY